MKKIVSVLIVVLSIFQSVVTTPEVLAADISATLSDSSLVPGQLVTLRGNGFGDAPLNGQVCFGSSVCSTSSTFRDIVLSWTNNSITLQIPYGTLPTSDTLSITSGSDVIRASYTYDQLKPEIFSANPTQITADETIITIQGKNLRALTADTRICINNSCIVPEFISSYVVSWTDSEIRLQVPYIANLQTFSLRLGFPIYTTASGDLIEEFISVPGFSYNVSPDPVITSLSPSSVIPGQTIVTITGKGFENSYKAGWHSLCFNRMCLTDESAKAFISQWSDTQISFIVPKEFSIASTLTVSLFLKYPSENAYKELAASTPITLQAIPSVERYTMDTTSGGGGIFLGRNFGTRPGSVQIGSTPLEIISWSDDRIEVYIPQNTQSGDAVIRTVDGKESVGVFVQVRTTDSYSNDLYSGEQWYFPVIKMREAWQNANLQAPITVAVLDSGVNFSHEDMQGRSWINTDEIENNGIDDDGNGFVDDRFGWNFVENTNNLTPNHEHGTMVASTIAAQKDNLLGFSGVAPNAKIMSIVVTSPTADSPEPIIPFDAAQRGIKYAVDNGAKIINLSFSGATPNPIYKEVLDYAYKHNVLVVAAAGNNNTNLANSPHSPICDESSKNEVLGVSSVNQNIRSSSFANFGVCIDIVAPGEDIFASIPSINNNDYAYASGTSFATPLVTGVAALLWTRNPDWNVEEVKTALIQSSLAVNNLPLLNAERALLAARPSVTYTSAIDSSLELKDNNSVIELETPKIDPVREQGQMQTPIPETLRFPDVPTGYIHFDAINYLAERNIIQGYPSGIFAPERSINRAEFLKIVLEARGFQSNPRYVNCFTDVKTDWYAPYVCYAKEQGYIEGYPDPSKPRSNWSFRPDQTINKVEAMKILLTVFGEGASTASSTSYRDVPSNAWYTPYVARAESLGLLMENILLYPGENMTRGKISEMTYRLLYLRENNLSRFDIL